jgi:hypothetical protein
MRLLRLLILALALAGTTVSQAWAQTTAGTVVVTVGAPLWSSNRPDTGQLNNTVNRADCMTPEVTITFDVSLSAGQSGKVLEVWSGSDCGVQTNRNENTNCVKAYTGEAISKNVTVNVKDILQKTGDSTLGPNTGTEMTCDEGAVSSEATARVLWFLVLDPGSLATPLGQKDWHFKFDLSPPDPPTDVEAGSGEESIVVKFKSSANLDVNQYRVYCAEDEGGCTSSTLVQGDEVPEDAKECGKVNSTLATEITATGLENGTSYAVALVAQDKLGNIGKLSEVSCAVPKEVTGFFEAYRAAGGQGGGGFCSFAPARHGVPALLGLALAGLALLRRRR